MSEDPTISSANTQPEKLRLNFNERSDFTSPVEAEFPFAGSLWQYPERQPLEKQIAEKFQLLPAQVLCTNGGDEAIMILMRIIKETSRLILPLPAFSQYHWGVESWQLDSQLIPANQNLTINIEAILSAIKTPASVSGTGVRHWGQAPTPDSVSAGSVSGTGSKTGSADSGGIGTNSVTVITRPNNPSGEMISIQSLLSIVETAEANNGWVFVDEAYIEFSEVSSAAATLLSRFDNVVILRTLSKAYGLAGIRLGYLLGSERLIKTFETRCAPFNIARPTLEIATRALSSEHQADADGYCKIIIRNRQKLYNWLKAIKVKVLPSQANFLVLPLPNLQANAIQSFLNKSGVLVRTFDSDNMENCLRITIPYSTERLQNLLQQALKPELVCLDMDGVLIDTSGSYDATVIATVKKLAAIDVDKTDIEQLRAHKGYNNDWVVSQKLLQDRGFECDLDTVTEVFQRIYLGVSFAGSVDGSVVDSVENGAENDPDSHNLVGLVNNEVSLINTSLKTAIQQSSASFAIVTGRPFTEAKAGLKLIGMSELDLISLDCVENPKPSPQGIQRLQQKYSRLSWMCGDNPDDMQAAVASNSLAIGIGQTNKDALYQAGADIVLDDINELEDWLCPMK